MLGACAANTRMAELYPDVAENAGRRIERVDFVDPEPFTSDSLQFIVQTKPSRCNFLGLPFCVPFTRIGREEHRLNPARVDADIQALERLYRIEGYFGTRVEPSARIDSDDDVIITYRIFRGDPVVLDVLSVTGTEGVLDPDSLARALPLQPGEIFHLGEYIASSDHVASALRRRGHAYVEVLRSFTVDTIDNRAEASLDVVPGPRVTIDSIIVQGADNLGRTQTLRQLEFRPGDVLRSSQLMESQRNLYALELVSLASVTVAPDSLQANPGDSTRATVIVQLSEAPVHEVEAAVGFGTVECLRTEAQWVSRSFRGGARRLAVRGAVSRIGVGEPFAIGAGERVCPTEPRDSIFGGSQFDYRLAADFTQPYFLGPRNQIGLNAYGERLSEPGVYRREAIGGSAVVSRRLGGRSGVAVSWEVERGQTLASPALFCAALLVCQPRTIDSLSLARFRSELGANYYIDRTNTPLDPTGGYIARTAISWATPLVGSEIGFFRWTGDAAHYRELRPGWVGAFALRLGNFFQTATLDPDGDFLPPEERFYLGGATTVRGFGRNALGPGVYVTDQLPEFNEAGDTTYNDTPQFVPTGGTALATMSAEVRMPSPFLARLLRLAVFVDGGAIGTDNLWDLGPGDWKFTPGAGIRLQTPVGPVRIDMGFNPYDPDPAPLLFSDAETGRIQRLWVHRPEARGFFDRFTFHLGVGHSF